MHQHYAVITLKTPRQRQLGNLTKESVLIKRNEFNNLATLLTNRAGTDSLMATLSELFDRREGYFANLVEIQGWTQSVKIQCNQRIALFLAVSHIKITQGVE